MQIDVVTEDVLPDFAARNILAFKAVVTVTSGHGGKLMEIAADQTDRAERAAMQEWRRQFSWGGGMNSR